MGRRLAEEEAGWGGGCLGEEAGSGGGWLGRVVARDAALPRRIPCSGMYQT